MKNICPYCVAALAMVFSSCGLAQQPQMPNDLERDIKTRCEAPGILPQQILLNLSQELTRIREATKKFSDDSEDQLVKKSWGLRQSNQWTDNDEEKFYRDMYGSNEYLDLEDEKKKMIESYMQVTERALGNLASADYKSACSRAVLLVEVARQIDAITKKQWQYMQGFRDSTLETARSRKPKP